MERSDQMEEKENTDQQLPTITMTYFTLGHVVIWTAVFTALFLFGGAFIIAEMVKWWNNW